MKLIRLYALLLLAVLTAIGQPTTYQQQSNWRGYWLENDSVKVFVATEPRLRLLHLSQPPHGNLLRDAEDDVSGLKTGYLAPGHRPDSFAVGDQASKLLISEENRLVVETPVEPSSTLSLKWEVRLSETAPIVIISQQLTNHASEAREFAAWSLLAVDLAGQISITGVADTGASLFPLAGPPLGTQAQQLKQEVGILQIDLEAPIHPYILRTGIKAETFAFAYQHPEGQLNSEVGHETGPWSPPGINLLFYADASPQERFAELEHLSALRQVPSGESITLVQTLRLSPPAPSLKTETPSTQQTQALQPLVLNYSDRAGVTVTEEGTVQAWTAPLENVPVALLPVHPDQAPRLTPEGLAFHQSPLDLPRLSPLQAAGPKQSRSVEICFRQEKAEATGQPEMLFEIGGSGNGYNLWLEGNQLCAGVWGKDPQTGEVEEVTLQATLADPSQWIRAKLELDTQRSEVRLWVDEQPVANAPLPKVQAHRDRCAVGGIQGSTRLRGAVLRSDDLPFTGTIRQLRITM